MGGWCVGRFVAGFLYFANRNIQQPVDYKVQADMPFTFLDKVGPLFKVTDFDFVIDFGVADRDHGRGGGRIRCVFHIKGFAGTMGRGSERHCSSNASQKGALLYHVRKEVVFGIQRGSGRDARRRIRMVVGGIDRNGRAVGRSVSVGLRNVLHETDAARYALEYGVTHPHVLFDAFRVGDHARNTTTCAVMATIAGRGRGVEHDRCEGKRAGRLI